MRTDSSVRSTTGARLSAPKPTKAKAKPAVRPQHPHTTPKPAACHCSPTPHRPCAHTPGAEAKKRAAAKKAHATRVAKAQAMTPGQKKAAAEARHASAVKAAKTRAAHKKAAKLANPHQPAAKKPAKKAC